MNIDAKLQICSLKNGSFIAIYNRSTKELSIQLQFTGTNKYLAHLTLFNHILD